MSKLKCSCLWNEADNKESTLKVHKDQTAQQESELRHRNAIDAVAVSEELKAILSLLVTEQIP